MPQIYREDLLAIEEIIRNDLEPDEYTIVVENQNFGTMASISETNTPVTTLRILARLRKDSTVLSIDFAMNGATISLNNSNNVKARGTYTKLLEDVLLCRERKGFNFLFNKFVFPILFAFLGVAAGFRPIETPFQKYFFSYILVGLFVLYLVFIYFGYFLNMKHYSKIYFVYYNTVSLTARNRDAAIVSIMTVMFLVVMMCTLLYLFGAIR